MRERGANPPASIHASSMEDRLSMEASVSFLYATRAAETNRFMQSAYKGGNGSSSAVVAQTVAKALTSKPHCAVGYPSPPPS